MNIPGRYNSSTTVRTPLDPIEDLVSWISTLRSKGYTSDVLKREHGFADAKEIRTSADLIGILSSNAVGLMEQAYSGRPQHSYLPLYYALLNLSKIYVVAAGNREKLFTNRYHGVSYNPVEKNSRDLLNERIVLKTNGVFRLFYESTTKQPWVHSNRKLTLKCFYPFIQNIGHEFFQFYKQTPPLQPIEFDLVTTSKGGHKVRVMAPNVGLPHYDKIRYYKILKGFSSTRQKGVFETRVISGMNERDARQVLLKQLNRELIYCKTKHNLQTGRPLYVTPLSNIAVHLVEEIPIWLAFYHLSNIVRYNPEQLEKIQNEKSWGMLLALRKHAILRFMLLFWSNFHQTEFKIESASLL